MICPLYKAAILPITQQPSPENIECDKTECKLYNAPSDECAIEALWYIGNMLESLSNQVVNR